MQFNHLHALAAVAAGASLSAAATAAVPTVAGFDVDEQGFTGSTISTVQIHSANGGNPDGHVVIRRVLGDPGFVIGTENMTSPEFLGDYGADGIYCAGFDIQTSVTAFDEVRLRFRDTVTMNGWYYNFGPRAVSPDWDSYDIVFNPEWGDLNAMAHGWVQEVGAGSFASTFASVGWIEIRLINEGSAIAGIDNVRLTVPAPSVAAIGLLGLGAFLRRRCR